MRGSYELEAPPRPYIPPAMGAAASALACVAAVMERGWQDYVRTWVNEAASSLDNAPSMVLCAAACSSLGIVLLMVAGLRCLRRRQDRETANHAGTLDGSLPSFMARLCALPVLSDDSGRARRFRLLGWVGIGCIIGALAGAAGCLSRSASAAKLLTKPASSFEFRIVGDAQASSWAYRHQAHAYLDGARAGTVELSCDEEFPIGMNISCVGRVEALAADSWGRSSYVGGEVASVRVLSVVEQSQEQTPVDAARDRVLAAIDPAQGDGRALLAGIVCGRTTELNASLASDTFAQTGTSHLIAVSGSHLAFVVALVEASVKSIGLKRLLRFALLTTVMGVYVLFTGGDASAVRSFIMVACSMLAGLGDRRSHGLSALAVSVLVLVVADAGIVFDLGFQLSAASVLFIQVFGGYVTFRLRRLHMPRMLAEALALTFCAQWATLPITVPVFGTCSLIAPVANVVLGPVMSALLIAGLVAALACLLAPWLSVAFIPAFALARVSIFCASAFAAVPHASISMVLGIGGATFLYGLAAAVYIGWMRIRGTHFACALGACALIAFGQYVRWRYLAPPEVIILDVGQADSILIRDGSSAVLVDAGVDDEVATALARNNVRHLDAVVITHWDSDHCGGLDAVFDTVGVERIVVAEGAAANAPQSVTSLDLPRVESVLAGDSINVGRFCCRVVWPRSDVDGFDNEDSIALDVAYEDAGVSMDVLLTGDTEVDEERAYAYAVGEVDVLKLGHHGSAESVDAEVLEMFDPLLAVASAGEGNRYGHPAEACIELLAEHGTQTVCTKDVGDVRVSPVEGGISVSYGRTA